MVVRGGVWVKWVKESRKYKLNSYKINHGNIIYSMATIVNNTI